MSIEVKVGQVWQDKDKRRNTVIEIISVPSDLRGDAEVTGLVIGTEETRSYQIDRLVKRWKLVETKQTEHLTEVHLGVPKDIEIEVVTKPDGSGSARVVKETPAPKHKTREQWLQAAVKELTKLFAKAGHEVPEVRVSVGWPGGRGKKKNVIGQCFATKTTADKVAQIFVSPVIDSPLAVVIVMAHELIHAVDDCESAHKKNFVRIAKDIGFIPKWTVATEDTISDELREKLEPIAERLGTYPHAAINPEDRPKVQKTYMLKVVCTEDPDYFVRMTQGKLEDYGPPICPCHNESMELEEK